MLRWSTALSSVLLVWLLSWSGGATAATSPTALVQTADGLVLEWTYQDTDLQVTTESGLLVSVHFEVQFDGGAFTNVFLPTFSTSGSTSVYRVPAPSMTKNAGVRACAAAVCSVTITTAEPPPPPPPAKFTVGQRVQAYGGTEFGAGVAVRAQPNLSSTITFVHQAGTKGTVLEGPASADGFTWWRVDYDNSPDDGWGTENNLEACPAPCDLPPPPPPVHVSSITVNAATVEAGTNIVVSWACKAVCQPNDWIGLFPAGSTREIWWQYAGSAGPASFTQQAPLTPGGYEFRYCLATTSNCPSVAVFTVTSPPPPPVTCALTDWTCDDPQWSTCSAAGQQTRTVTCRRSYVEVNGCVVGTEPLTETRTEVRSCTPPPACDLKLTVEAWPTKNQKTAARFTVTGAALSDVTVTFVFTGNRSVSATAAKKDGSCAVTVTR